MKHCLNLLAVYAAALLMSTTTSAESKHSQSETAILGGGCFWCLEAVYQRLPGVTNVQSGYTGGHVKNPTYKQVCGGDTGHAEVARIEFDPAKLSYAKLLQVFFEAHDPTTLNRQGADEGTQYRSVIYYLTDIQKKQAEEAKAAAQAHWDDPIVTEISPVGDYYPAEDYHQNYYNENPNQGYCAFVIRPKVKKLQDKGVISKEK